VTLVVGRVCHSLHEGDVVCGVTLLDNLLYVLRINESRPISVYDADSFRFQRHLQIPPGARTDLAACAHNRCLYISGFTDNCVQRVALPDAAVTKWQIDAEVHGLSVTDTHSVLATCANVREIREFSTDGKLLRQIRLARDVASPCHAIQLSNGQFIVCHGGPEDPVHRVCLIGSDGDVVKSYGGPLGSGKQHMAIPLRLAVDRNGFVYVVDLGNCRVLLLSPELTYEREVVSKDQLKGRPLRLCLDADKDRLYVADNELDDESYADGRVVIFNV